MVSDDVFRPEIVRERLEKWFPEINGIVRERLVLFQSELFRLNKVFEIVSAGSVNNAESLHIADCVLGWRLLKPMVDLSAPLYDFGGNGLPGLIFAILESESKALQVRFIAHGDRRVEFIRHVISTLALAGTEVSDQRLEGLADRAVRQVVTRNFLPLPKALILGRRLFPQGGRFFHLKSDSWTNELAAVPSQVFSHWAPQLLGQYRLPETTTQMAVVLTEKLVD